MIGTKFYKPLELDKLTRTVIRTIEREIQERVPVFDDAGSLIYYKTVTKTVIEEVPEQEEYDNPAPNTMNHYCEAAQWCNANMAYIEDRGEYYEVVSIPELTEEELAAAALAQAKAERSEAVSKITVEIDGMTFDGDEKAQERMARAVLMAESPEEQTAWVLADNTVAMVTAEQLRRACRAAGKAQTELWTVPYEASYTPVEAA